MRKKSRLNTAFHYLILLEPRCFAHPDGSLQEIKKTSVVHLIKGSINSSIPDGMFLIQTSANDKTPIFTVFTRSVLLKVLKFTKHRVDLCLDVYESLSIKDIKRKSKEDENTEEHFTFGHPQWIPSVFNEMLKISCFKCQLLRFLYKEYEDPVYGAISG